jgi:alcohol dehydrogenase (cytochrome c)
MRLPPCLQHLPDRFNHGFGRFVWDPADWLMIRRDYKASSFSPPNQIMAQNVNDLRLVWSWAMQDGAVLGNQPAPIVHGGVLHVYNNGMVRQALNARTGELIWENRYGTGPTA